MDDFERRYLLCRSDSTTSILSSLRSLSFIPGPTPVAGEMSSVELTECVEHPLEYVRIAIRSLSGVTETTFEDRPGLSMFEWRSDDRTALLEVGECEDESPTWFGSSLETHCLFSDLLALWNELHRAIPAVWLHNGDCDMFSPEAFVETIALPALQPALEAADEETRARALAIARGYRRAVDEFRES